MTESRITNGQITDEEWDALDLAQQLEGLAVRSYKAGNKDLARRALDAVKFLMNITQEEATAELNN